MEVFHHNLRDGSLAPETPQCCMYIHCLYIQRRKSNYVINYCLILYDMVIMEPEEVHVPHACVIKAPQWPFNTCGNLTLSWQSYWTCGVSRSPEILKLVCSGFVSLVLVDWWFRDGLYQSSACKEAFNCSTQDSRETPERCLDWERNYSVLWSKIGNEGVDNNAFNGSVGSLQSVPEKHAARVPFSVRSPVKFVTSVRWKNHHLIMSARV